jgi:hypothetical protein
MFGESVDVKFGKELDLESLELIVITGEFFNDVVCFQ